MKEIYGPIIAALLLSGMLIMMMSACGKENPLEPTQPGDDEIFDKSLEIIRQIGDTPPAEQATVALGGESLTFWPYTGTTFDGAPVDPVNVVFAGEADPLQIRAALLALDGDRTAFGFPAEPPFDAVWLDALGGDVQTSCTIGGHGWVGSVVQLTLGDYGPLRAHLRLFRTGVEGEFGCWTLGGAHFEMQIPGTTDHQVLSWELAEQLVVADLMRTGLLDAEVPVVPTGAINAAPSFRTIPAEIYNLLPPALVAIVGGPEPPVTEPVPLASDGQGSLVNVASAAVVEPGVYTTTTTVTFDQMVPRPFCSEGPGDWLRVDGPVDFQLRTEVDENGRFFTRSRYLGDIVAQPFDLSSGVPVPVGDPFPARVSGRADGFMHGGASRIVSVDRRFTREGGGPQILIERLRLPEVGNKVYRAQVRCIDD